MMFSGAPARKILDNYPYDELMEAGSATFKHASTMRHI